MTMSEWAKNEVEIAKKHERGENASGEWDYGCACYDSALKAYLSLMDDGHSGFSFGVTMCILKRLMAEKPLTPIEDTDDIWSKVKEHEYQCKRMGSLFKDILEDGSVKYTDVNRVICIDAHSGIAFHNGFISSLINKQFPITMPYYPSIKPYRVFREDILTDPANGDFDTIHIIKVTDPSGEIIMRDLYFKEKGDSLVEIDEKEYADRYAHRIIRGGGGN